MLTVYSYDNPSYIQQNGARVFGLDLVRAIAIGLVLAAHYGVIVPYWIGYKPLYPIAVLGLLGVNLFFILSGFLIGRLLIDVIVNSPSFANMWIFLVRRWMRTLPLYITWLCISVIFFPPPDHQIQHFLSYLTFTQNLAWPMPVSNWFGVSWSLAVEEWFYVLFGVCATGFVLVIRNHKAALIPLLALCIVPAVLRWMVPDTADWNNEVTKIVVLRLDSIGYGVMLAWIRTFHPRIFAYPFMCASIGVGLAVAAWASMASGVQIFPFHVFRTFIFTVLDLAFALCIVGAAAWADSRGYVARIVRKISDISYGLYLTHLTILLAGGSYLVHGFLPTLVGVLIIPIIISLLSWHFFELPILKLRPRHKLSKLVPAE